MCGISGAYNYSSKPENIEAIINKINKIQHLRGPDDKGLWIDTFMDGKARYFDISDPHNPSQVFEEQIGSQINMISQSWDGKRAYFSTSLLGKWDKTGEADEQWVKLYNWDADKLELSHVWTIDFYKEKLGRAHQMRFGAYSLYGQKPNKNNRLAVK